MNPNEKIEWSALEYEEKERNNDWFWALGVIVVAGSITSIIFSNYFFAILLLLGGGLLAYFAIKKPETFFYELNDKGFKTKSRLYPYENIKSFWVQKESFENEKVLKPTLFVKSKRLVMPILSVPIENALGEKIKAKMLASNVIEEEMKEHPSEHIMESLGF